MQPPTVLYFGALIKPDALINMCTILGIHHYYQMQYRQFLQHTLSLLATTVSVQ